MKWNKLIKKLENKEYEWIGSTFVVLFNETTMVQCKAGCIETSCHGQPFHARNDFPAEVVVAITKVLDTRKFEKHEIEPGTFVPCCLLSNGDNKVYVRPCGCKFSVDKDGKIHFEEDEVYNYKGEK